MINKESIINKQIEQSKRWLARVVVLRTVFVAIVGIKILPSAGGLTLSHGMIDLYILWPIFVYVLLEEAKIKPDSIIRILEREALQTKARKENNASSRKTITLKRSRRRRRV